MRKKTFNIVMALSITFLALSSAFILITPSSTKAQATGDNADLLESIRAIFDESISRLSNEIQSLRSEIDVLRTEVQQQTGSGGSYNSQPFPSGQHLAPPTIVLRLGDSGPNVERLQDVLIRLGYNIPAGVTGNFFEQTQRALRQLQIAHNIPSTGVFDNATRVVIEGLIDFQTVYSPPTTVYPTEPTTPTQNTQPSNPSQPVITPGLRLDAPFDGLQTAAGAQVQIIWSTTYAPAGAKVSFHLKNRIYGIRQPVYETSELSGEYLWTTPTNMPSDNDLTAKLVYEQSDGQMVSLASRTVMVSLIGSTIPTDTTTTTNTTPTTSTTSTTSGDGDTNYDQYVAFYKGAEFTSCMAEYPSTVSLIAGWIDDGLLRHQFPWGEITGGAANKVAECEAGQFNDYNYSTYTDCTANTSESSCQANTACEWFDTFCGMAGYDPGSGGGDYGYCSAYTSSNTCTAETNCYWYESSGSGSSYCYYDSGGGSTGGNDCTYNSSETMCVAQTGCQWFTTSTGNYCSGNDHVPGTGGNPTSQMYSCFYPNATINGTQPGYTVWCEYDYVNCHVGSQSGDVVPLDGLSLGAPSSCESGWNNSGKEQNRFLAAVSVAFSSILKSIGFVFGF
jgi:peptidoglycan hydrolase-like protein with peptidoglycan-binding domain